MGACSIDNSTPNSIIKCRFAKICNFTCPKPLNWADAKMIPQIQDHQEKNNDFTWLKIREEAMSEATREPILKDYYYETVLSHASLESALASLLAAKLSSPSLSKIALLDILSGVIAEDETIGAAARDDLRAARERDPACLGLAHCLLNFKGFQACQSHRAAHGLWSRGRTALAVLIQSRASEVFGVDIHPGARIGSGVVIDHATGVVIGETAVVGDNVTILHGVTLGGTGKVSGDRHPKVGDGVFIGAGSKILGCVRIGSGARVGAGSVVLKEVPPNATAVGNPARVIGG